MQVGIDIVENKRIKFTQKFVDHLLSVEEQQILQTFTNKQRQREFLAGRWAIKEAIYKCQTLRLPVTQISVVNDAHGRPYVKNKELNHLTISISHEKKYTVAVAIDHSTIEKGNK